MCGIFGVLAPRAAGLTSEAARRALADLAHRGPDDEGWYETPEIVLGHRRLSIMDLSSAGHQPMANEDGTVWLTFNGEIYRFREVREDLERLGHVFRSHADSEVLIHGWEAWGSEVLERVDGMFAFALWDARARTLLLARDRLGKKPLFVARRGATLAFASQIRPLVTCGLAEPVIDPEALRGYLFANYVLGPRTVFRGVELLPAGSWLLCRNGAVSTGRYWDLARAARALDGNDPQRVFEATLAEATRARLVSDAPLGIFLSGGLDSAVVAALAQRDGGRRQSTFSVGFEDPSYDESPKAARVAARLGTAHHEVVCRPEDVPDLLPWLTRSADHLLADQSMIPLAKLAREARRSVKVVLTGDGGDELLAGYPTYRALRVAAAYIRAVPRPLRAVAAGLADRLPASSGKMAPSMLLARFLRATTGSLARAHASWRTIHTHEEIDGLLGGRWGGVEEWRPHAERLDLAPGWPLIKAAVHADIATFLVDSILAKVDRATMAFGLEARSPLLDSRLMALAFGTFLAAPERYTPKVPLRRLAVALLGAELASVRKEGFQTPFAAWFAGPLRDYARSQLESLTAALPDVLDKDVLLRIEAEHAARRRDHSLKLWSLVALAEWCRVYPGLRLAG